MKTPVLFLLLATVVALSACGRPASDFEYLGSRLTPELEVPPDLTLEKVDSKFELPETFSDSASGSVNKIPVLARVDSIKLEGNGDFYWLSVNEPVGNLYQLVKDFWASEGFTLAMDEPVIGVMKTEWVYNEEGKIDADKGFFARLFSWKDLSATQDQFKTRIARDADLGTSQIYISHRGTAYEHIVGDRLTEAKVRNKWGFRASEPELEVEMLSRLMVYLGLRQSEVDGQLAQVKLFAPRASLHTDFDDDVVETRETGLSNASSSEDQTYLLIRDEYSRGWYRTLHQLERLNIEVISANITTGLSGNGVIQVQTDIEAEEKKSGFFGFGSRTEVVKKKFRLIFSEEDENTTRVDLETIKGKAESSEAGLEFLTLLYQQLK